ncbi:MAG: lipoprotein [Gammaproteobacteria bacterium]|jgi:hypothetical protein|nr:lipoprotein [Gammaproteobacteria bacterium]
MNRVLWLAVSATALVGCATPPTIYRWGSYEDVVYGSYSAPGSVAPQMQVEILEKDYQAARAANQRMPPGWHAHLGYLYFQLGKADQAHQELVTEKAQFPESSVFVDRLLANLKKQ